MSKHAIVAIIGAMEQEIELLKEFMHNPEEELIGGVKMYFGRLFNRDHTTVLHALRKVAA